MIIEGARYNGAPQLAMEALRPYVDQLTGSDPRFSGDVETAKRYVGYGTNDAEYQSMDHARFQAVTVQLHAFEAAQKVGDKPIALASIQSALDGLAQLDRGPKLLERINDWFHRND